MTTGVFRRVPVFLALSGLVVLAGCNVVRPPWQPGRPAPDGSAPARSASEDSAQPAGDTVVSAASGEEEAAAEEQRPELSPEAIEAMRAAVGGDTAAGGARASGDTAGAGAEASSDSAKRPAPTTLEGLKEAGPTFVRYDESPQLQRSDRLTELLESHLMPVIEEQDLSLRTSTLFWVLVTEEGSVADAAVHTTSTVDSFDQAAAEVARSLSYQPARRGGEPVPVWILTRVHLLMP